MKTPVALLIPGLLMSSLAANAGTVYEMATRTMQGEEIDRMTFYEDGDQSRMDQNGAASGSMTVIFKEEGFYVLDHAQKNYILMDEAMIDNISSQISEAMKQMEAQLASMPPEQRAMMEQMLEAEMPGMMSGKGGKGGIGNGPVLDIKPAGKGRWKSYDCRKFHMLEDGVKIQEICATDYSAIDGSGELRDSFNAMGKFLSKLFDAIPFGGEGVRNPLEMWNRFDGFPVQAIEFENGVAVRETTLESAAQKNIDASMFELPADYEQMDPFKQ